jgi:hypothetical protein
MHDQPVTARLQIILIFAIASMTAAEEVPSFSRDVLPILSDNCFHCHGMDKNSRKGGLRLDVEKDAKEIKDGIAAILPGDAAKSHIIQRILSTDPDEVMPPPKLKRTLTAAQTETLKRWINTGAKWGKHWAFEPVTKPAAPSGEQKKANPIDAFVRAKLDSQKLPPSPRATPETLVRRMTLHLTGLPPTPQEVSAFIADYAKDDKGAIKSLADRLLASPRYGERMAWDWMDAARYADTNGFQGDPERTMWPWRDWVVRAFNDNMPYDQFTIWQLGGDLLPNATQEQKLATGFSRNHMMNGEGGRIAEETRVENVMDRAETTATIWMGLTMTCARCHDHKFDPISHRDYFALYDFFNQTSETGQGRGGQAAPVMDLSTPGENEAVKIAQQSVDEAAKEVEKFELKKFPRAAGKPLTESDAIKLPGNLPATLAKIEPVKRSVDGLLEAVGYFKGKDEAYVKVLNRLLAAVRKRTNASSNITRVMIMDTLPQRRDTFVLNKGAYDKPLPEKVSAETPSALPPMTKDLPKDRLGLAKWIIARENPLTSRVTVNRFWQMFFGTGFVKTAEDFGVQSERPSHPELLDWLSAEFMESGWDMKHLCRLIVTSDTYLQSSNVTAALHERDPENRLLARGSRHRLPSWMIRDQALALSGLLTPTIGGPAVKPYQPAGIWEEATFGKKTYVQDTGDKLYRRSLYIFWRRIVGPTMFFDNSPRQYCSVKGSLTNTPLHALVTMNETAHAEAARKMAERVLREGGKAAADQIRHAFTLATARAPTAKETEVLLKRHASLSAHYAKTPAEAKSLLTEGESPADKSLLPADIAAMAGVCSLILNLDEVLCRE